MSRISKPPEDDSTQGVLTPLSKPGLLSNCVVVPPGVGVGVGVFVGVGVGVGVFVGVGVGVFVGVGVGVPPVMIACDRAQELVSFDQVACMG